MTPDQIRLDHAYSTPRILQLWKAVQGLKTPLQFMMSGAHPDDENAHLLAALHYRDGVNVSYTCSTRGEGGQNNLGTERGANLGALRTAEMEAACDVLNMRMYWLSESPNDSISDWRFSKSGSETLNVWGHDRTLARFVNVIRRDRPDMLCPTFLDVPGQHGHHRAMTRLAHEVFEAAADPNYKGSGLPIWSVSKLYLPATSGAGYAYDDDLPPPPETVRVNGSGYDPVTGWRYSLIGAISHGNHRSQGMGHWPKKKHDIPLHLAETRVGDDTSAITDNLPISMSDIGLDRVQNQCDEIVSNIANTDDILKLARDVYETLAKADVHPIHSHRVELKRTQISRVIALCNSTELNAVANECWLTPETKAKTQKNVSLSIPKDWKQREEEIGPSQDTPPYDGYRDYYDPLIPPLPALLSRDEQSGAESLWPLCRPVMASPSNSISLEPAQVMLNVQAGGTTARVQIKDCKPTDAKLDIDIPNGWEVVVESGEIRLSTSPDTAEGFYTMPIKVNGDTVYKVHKIDYPHIRPTQYVKPAELKVSIVNTKLPKHAVGYIGAGLDTVANRLSELGVDVIDLSNTGPTEEALRNISSLVIGIHAIGFNSTLSEGLGNIHQWVKNGGHLLTLYHRPWDNWDPQATPLLPLEIGQPSLRWRVTDKDAKVKILEPDHEILCAPNIITQADFDGWDKERGLYFANDWDAAYKPILSMSDPQESPQLGGLLIAQVNKGRHIHCALNLHHQLDKMIPGAIRLLMNLLSNKR